MICLKSELSGIDIFIVRHDDPASEKHIFEVSKYQKLLERSEHGWISVRLLSSTFALLGMIIEVL